MTNSTTKIELVTEAIEALVLASIAAFTVAHEHGLQRAREAAHQNVLDTRQGVSDALKEFLAPALRIVTEHERRVGDMSVTSRKTIESIPAPDARPTYPAA